MKKIYLLAIGGTISYIKGESYKKDGRQILKEADLQDNSEIEIVVWDVLHKPSSDMLVEDLFTIAKEANRAIREGADGIVVTQGTDTIEETAFFLELTVPNVVPVIVTGAMKHTGLLGADGGANIRASIMAAASDLLKKEGCMVVFNELVLPSWYVRKTNTQSLDTFKAQFGPVGYFSEGKLRVPCYGKKPDFNYIFGEEVLNKTPAEVYVHSVNIGDDGRVLKAIKELGYQGVVIDGFGGGHCTAAMSENIKTLGREFPVIMSSRTGSGEVQTETYMGYPGSEIELIKDGVIYAGILDGRKARILLILMLTSGKSTEQIREEFHGYSVFDY